MEKVQKRKLWFLIVAIVVLVLVGNVLLGLFLQQRSQQQAGTFPKTQVVAQQAPFSYNGEQGKDALTLLKQKTSVVQDASGLVTGINGRKADSGRHEYWAFYVNGKLAQIGPAQYQTKDSDKIVWKIEHY